MGVIHAILLPIDCPTIDYGAQPRQSLTDAGHGRRANFYNSWVRSVGPLCWSLSYDIVPRLMLGLYWLTYV